VKVYISNQHIKQLSTDGSITLTLRVHHFTIPIVNEANKGTENIATKIRQDSLEQIVPQRESAGFNTLSRAA
jgi:hypothetical protein